jgi:hypothetical protein
LKAVGVRLLNPHFPVMPVIYPADLSLGDRDVDVAERQAFSGPIPPVAAVGLSRVRANVQSRHQHAP